MLDKKIRDFLVPAFEHLQRQNSLIHDALTEVAALRDSLLEVGRPEYSDILDSHRARLRAAAKPAIDDQFQKFEEIIRQLRAPGNFV